MSQNKKIYVGNIPYKMSKEDLQELFGQFGNIENIALPSKGPMDRRDQSGGFENKGFAFVTFDSPQSAQDAIKKLDGTEFQGRTLRVNFANEDNARTGGGGGGGGGRGGRGGRSGSSGRPAHYG